ncbi:MAG: hypothetical protein PWP03_639 [Candidatus Woesearchaeota archaeon]|nr:hypothetical protein [Candidatus Woesearchaeota archaeon]MDN5328001.1 hypothetical protein [Candidatus Woesearchaeota archaeon]
MKTNNRFNKVLLINPPFSSRFIRETRCQHKASKIHTVFHPLTLLYTATLLEKNGIRVKIFDFNVEKRKDFSKVLKQFKPELIISTTSTPTIESDLEFLKEIKSKTNAKIALTSVHSTYFYKEILNKQPFIDYILLYEPEMPALELCSGIKFTKIKGLAYREKGEIKANNEPNRLDLKKIKMPSWHLVKVKRYKIPIINEPYALIQTGRGCPFNCDFCVVPFYFGHKVRKRNVADVVDEIKFLKKKGINFFYFFDETFNDDNDFLVSLLQAIKPLNITFVCNSRSDLLTEEQAKLFSEAGVFFIGFGIESFSDSALKKMNKKEKSKVIIQKIELANKHRIPIFGHFLIGYGSDPIKDALTASKLGLTFANFYTVSPFPGSALYEKVKKKNIDFKKVNFEDFGSKKDKFRKKLATLIFYSNPFVLFRIFKLFSRYLLLKKSRK